LKPIYNTMKRILYIVLVAVLAMSAGTVWAQTNRTLGNIPDGWKVQAGSVNFTADENNHEVQIPAGSTVTLTPLYPAKVKSVKLKDVPPTGAIKGEFTVNASGKQVWFSQGNLQATTTNNWSSWTFSFMEHQYSTVETSGNGDYCTANYGDKDVVSLFGWATSGYSQGGGECYLPYSTTADDSKYYAYKKASYNLYDSTGKADWGYIAISNGGNTENSGWRTLTTEEWQYLFGHHTTGWSTVNGVSGYVIRPDGVSTVIADSYTAEDWATEEAAGSVFLPASGSRILGSAGSTRVLNVGYYGYYWSSSSNNSSAAYNLYFANNSLEPGSSSHRYYGMSVRLVKTVPHIVDLSTLTGDSVVHDGDILINTLAGNYKITIADGATVTLRGASINAAGTWTTGDYAGITCLGDATIILADGTTNTVTGFHHYYPGIFVPQNKTLTIKGETAGTSSLTASSNYSGDFCAAGIGAGYQKACGNILIESGTIVAEGGSRGAGIGGAGFASCGTITITGGTVTATGGEHGAGIGSGYKGNCQSISITGGTVIATGYGDGAGIGSGKDGSCSTITIADGVTQVTAKKGSTATNSIGKGAGTASCGTVTIGGTVYYNGTNYENEGATYLAQSPLGYPAKVAAAATAGDLGKVIGANGCIYDDAAAATAAGTTALALICYVGSDASNAPYNHGLALALTDANDGNYATWCSQSSTPLSTCLTTQCNDETAAKADMAGIGNTLYLNYYAPTGHTHTAASAASDYAVSLPTGTSAWFLPSAGQWEKMINACKNVLGTNNNYTDLRDGFSTRGGTNLLSDYYWSSTEASADRAWLYKFGDAYFNSPGEWGGYLKGESYYVRSAIAF
jgi:hypothetical protein